MVAARKAKEFVAQRINRIAIVTAELPCHTHAVRGIWTSAGHICEIRDTGIIQCHALTL
jgi:hypothetical protein